MKVLFYTFLIVFVLSGDCFGQTEVPYGETDIEILFGCSIVGEYSPQLANMKKLCTEKNYNQIRDSLKSDDLLSQLLAVIILDKLSEQKTVKLSESEKMLMSNIKYSKKTYSFCTGCESRFTGTFKEIFTHNPYDNTLLNIYRNVLQEVGLEKFE